jgi:hypothetical protein
VGGLAAHGLSPSLGGRRFGASMRPVTARCLAGGRASVNGGGRGITRLAGRAAAESRGDPPL